VTCTRCGTEGVTFGHRGLCAECYAVHMAHQKALRDENQRNRELLAARLVHPAGRTPRHRAMDLWIQRKDPESGRNTA
jgi:hypothetical protein